MPSGIYSVVFIGIFGSPRDLRALSCIAAVMPYCRTDAPLVVPDTFGKNLINTFKIRMDTYIIYSTLESTVKGVHKEYPISPRIAKLVRTYSTVVGKHSLSHNYTK